MTICKIVKEVLKSTNGKSYQYIKDIKPCCCVEECMHNFDLNLYYETIVRQTKSKEFWEKLQNK